MDLRLRIWAIVRKDKGFSRYEGRVEQLYGEMDQTYQRIARPYGFVCTGCDDNCCETRFYHHTLSEYLYLRKGFLALEKPRRENILTRAAAVSDAYALADREHHTVRALCPLNEGGLCAIYPYRPMICRLHGIPHEFQRPGGEKMTGPGCNEFTRQCGNQSYRKFDRTPFYRQLALLEQELRKSITFADKFKMTIAEMVLLERVAHEAD
jgi:Fe-S-cluster containining protein